MAKFTLGRLFTAGVAAVGVALISAPAQASLMLSLEVASDNSKSVNVHVGDVVTLNVYGIVTGANGTADDGVQSATGSFVSTLTGNGAAIGNFAAASPVSPFNSGSTNGLVQDLNGQPGLDVGSSTTTADYVFFHAGALQVSANANPKFLLGTLEWTVTSIPAGGTTELNFLPRSINTGAVWREDGVNKNPTTGTFMAGAPVVVSVPEPGTLGLFGVIAASLLMSRRKRAASVA